LITRGIFFKVLTEEEGKIQHQAWLLGVIHFSSPFLFFVGEVAR
jgi:hypothetical protein